MQHSSKPINKLIIDYLEYCEVVKNLSNKTLENYSRFLNKFTEWLSKNNLKNIKPHELNERHIWNYRLFLSRSLGNHTRQSLKKTTQNYYLIALRGLLSYLVEKNINSIPPDKIKLPKLTDRDKQIKFLNLSQIKKLLNKPNLKTTIGLRDRAILESLFSTGLRVKELVSLNIEQFNFEEIKKTQSSIELSITGKGGRTRTIYFSQRCLYWLIKYLITRKDKSKALFINYSSPSPEADPRLTSRSIENIVKKYTQMAGLPIEATPHTLRHSYATDLLGKGADLRSVQELLGHKNIVTTQIYTHVTNKKLKKDFDKFHSEIEE